ncbi:MAG: class I SAM-dependent methyltransferase [Desulfobacteraceae bacterium]|jgi:SAM-dependent methyltransferase
MERSKKQHIDMNLDENRQMQIMQSESLRRVLTEVPDEPNERRSPKLELRKFYNNISQQLDSTVYGTFSVFLNYGYAANEAPQFSPIPLPVRYLNRNCVKLVLELIGDRDLKGKDLLDVGCGRGGGLATIKTFFGPRSLTGVDLSAEAIAFCRRTHTDRIFAFHEGDAEALAFVDEIFDVVCNIESSHTYSSIELFYAEVSRVLRKAGWFLYTDLLPIDAWKSGRQTLKHLGFSIMHDRDITENVLLSCDQIARTHMAAFSSKNDNTLMCNFLATPDSNIYDAMTKGDLQYRILWLKKGQ